MRDFYTPICRHLTMPLWAWWEKSDYLEQYRRLRGFERQTAAEVRRHQWQRLCRQVRRAYDDSPFYREFYDAGGFHPDHLRGWDDLAKVPILRKEAVKKNWRRMLAPRFAEAELFFGQTSGSTGKPLQFAIDPPAAQVQRAVALLTNEWGGYRPGARMYSFIGRSLKKAPTSPWRQWLRRTALDRSTNLCTLDLTEESMRTFHRALSRADRPFFYGYTHALHLFADFLARNGLHDVRAAGAVTGGMPLHSWQREAIEKMLHCPVLNRYGCEELGTIACECREGRSLHVQAFAKHVEVVDASGNPLPSGEAGYLVVTEFDNAAMPFIRYRIEDMGVLTERVCGCGRQWPLIERLEGRDSDFILTPEGKRVSGISLTDLIGVSIPGVFQIQLIQDKLDHIIVRIVRETDFGDASLRTIARLTEEYFGPRMRFSCEFVPTIPLEPSGKSRFVVSRLAAENLLPDPSGAAAVFPVDRMMR
ncbi:MAG: hypothetical protein WCY68_00400 [Desulfuromonadales bacterium]